MIPGYTGYFGQDEETDEERQRRLLGLPPLPPARRDIPGMGYEPPPPPPMRSEAIPQPPPREMPPPRYPGDDSETTLNYPNMPSQPDMENPQVRSNPLTYQRGPRQQEAQRRQEQLQAIMDKQPGTARKIFGGIAGAIPLLSRSGVADEIMHPGVGSGVRNYGLAMGGAREERLEEQQRAISEDRERQRIESERTHKATEEYKVLLAQQNKIKADELAMNKEAELRRRSQEDLSQATQRGARPVFKPIPIPEDARKNFPGQDKFEIGVPESWTQQDIGGQRMMTPPPAELAKEKRQAVMETYPVMTPEFAQAVNHPELAGTPVDPAILKQYQDMLDRRDKVSGDREERSARNQESDALRRELAASRGSREVTRDEFRKTQQLTKELSSDPNVKNFDTVRDSHSMMRNGAVQSNGVGDITLMRAFAKLTDPTTGVREEEYKTMKGAGGALNALEVFLSGKWAKGSQLTPETRQAFMTMADEILQNRKSNAEKALRRVVKKAENFGLDPSLITSGFVQDQDEGGPPLEDPDKAGGSVVLIKVSDGKPYNVPAANAARAVASGKYKRP